MSPLFVAAVLAFFSTIRDKPFFNLKYPVLAVHIYIYRPVARVGCDGLKIHLRGSKAGEDIF